MTLGPYIIYTGFVILFCQFFFYSYFCTINDEKYGTKAMRKVIIFLVFFSPLFIQAQVVSCHKTELKKTQTDKWEKVNYGLRVYEFTDSTILRDIINILSFNPDVDSIRTKSDDVTHILEMRFRQGGQDTVICNVAYLELPYLLEDLGGCCLISGYYVLLVGAIPSFLTPTKEVASFSYLSHKIYTYGFEMEEMGDDSVPQWVLGFYEKKVRLLRYYGFED